MRDSETWHFSTLLAFDAFADAFIGQQLLNPGKRGHQIQLPPVYTEHRIF